MKKSFFFTLAFPIASIYPAITGFTIKSGEHCEEADTYYELSEALKEPEKVVKLDIAMQKLTSISPEIGKLINLECLDLSFNRISDLPSEFANLRKLKYLNLAGTRYLPKLPKILTELPNLKELDLSDHPEWSAATYEEAKKLLPNIKIITGSK